MKFNRSQPCTLLILLILTPSAYSAYKCIDQKGNVSYQDRQCEPNTIQTEIGDSNASQTEIGKSSKLSHPDSFANTDDRQKTKTIETTFEELTTYPNEQFAQSMFDLKLLFAKRLTDPNQDSVNTSWKSIAPYLKFQDPSMLWRLSPLKTQESPM